MGIGFLGLLRLICGSVCLVAVLSLLGVRLGGLGLCALGGCGNFFRDHGKCVLHAVGDDAILVCGRGSLLRLLRVGLCLGIGIGINLGFGVGISFDLGIGFCLSLGLGLRLRHRLCLGPTGCCGRLGLGG